METKIPTGIRHNIELDVDKNHSACFFGSGQVEVFATPALIAIMEKAAMESVVPYLPKGYTTVGSEVNVKHLKATPIGMKVKSESYLKTVNGNKLIFELHAWDEKGMIGIGTHTRVVVEKKVFMEKLK
ncbi:MAG: thioesterase family protein [Bacteroidales bacterium]|nr:thioesterase family protein [Bacteroidales bacterium]